MVDKGPHKGTLYILDKHICFFSHLLGRKKRVLVTLFSIISIEKKLVGHMFPNALEIISSDGRFYFEGFVNRAAAFQSLWKQWESLKKKKAVLTTSSDTSNSTTTSPVKNLTSPESPRSQRSKDESIMNTSSRDRTASTGSNNSSLSRTISADNILLSPTVKRIQRGLIENDEENRKDIFFRGSITLRIHIKDSDTYACEKFVDITLEGAQPVQSIINLGLKFERMFSKNVF